jgi:uncharacterized protein
LDSGLYTVSTTCPICEKSFDVLKVKTSAIKLERIDEDFCIHYKDINPLLYEPWICEHCGYAGFGVNFAVMSELEIRELQKLCLMKFTEDPAKNPFELTDFHKHVYKYFDSLNSDGERDNLAAIQAYEILLLNQKARNASLSLRAKTLMRVGWIYRLMNDPREMEYLKEAADYFAKAYQMEAFPIGKFDSATCAYLIGELNRRIGNLREAMEWLGRVVRLPPGSETSKIVEKAREQIQVIKSSEEYANLK